jgi:N-acetylglucosaminyldiphosphoundecaprenol N-acetyl-beta-D-mannosaminyltransferase
MTSRVSVLGCELDPVDMQEAVERCRELIDSRMPAQHMSVNAAKLVALRSDARMREIVRASELVTADGLPVVWASRLLGDPLPMRVAGIDLMSRLLELAENRGYRIYVLGARDSVLEQAITRIRERHPRIAIAGHRHGYFADAESNDVVAGIRAVRPDILFVAISSPRKEYWLSEHGRELAVPLVMGVGGSIDVWAGETKRAPSWMQRTGLEWFYRFLQEPRRMWRRYLFSNVAFAGLLTAALVRRIFSPATKSASEGA